MKTFFRYKTRSTIYTSQPLQGYSFAAGCLKNGVEASESKITSVCPCMGGGTHMLFRDVHFGQFPVPKTSWKGRFTSCLLPICVLSQNLCAWMEWKCYFSKRKWQATVKAIFFAIHTTHMLIWLIADLVCSCACVRVCVCVCVCATVCLTIDILDYVNGIGNGSRMLNQAVHSYACRLCWSD